MKMTVTVCVDYEKEVLNIDAGQR